VNVEPLRLEGGEVAGDGLELFADRLEMVQAFPETEVVEIVVWTPLRAGEAEWELGTLATDK
jgi:hypothetical protein